jgi:hypothetical protein
MLVSRRMRMRPVLVIVFALGIGCNRGSNAEDATGETSTSTTVSDTTTEGAATTYAGPEPCGASDDCDGALVCAAPYDPATAMRGPAACVEACVDRDDLMRWCIDDGSCCEDLRCNAVDGFCTPRDSGGESGTESSGSGTTGDESTSDTGSTGKDDTTGSTGKDDAGSTGTGETSSSTG